MRESWVEAENKKKKEKRKRKEKRKKKKEKGKRKEKEKRNSLFAAYRLDPLDSPAGSLRRSSFGRGDAVALGRAAPWGRDGVRRSGRGEGVVV